MIIDKKSNLIFLRFSYVTGSFAVIFIDFYCFC